MHKLINTVKYVNTITCFCFRGLDDPLTFIQCLQYFDNFRYQIGLKDEFDLWPVYSVGRFKTS